MEDRVVVVGVDAGRMGMTDRDDIALANGQRLLMVGGVLICFVVIVPLSE